MKKERLERLTRLNEEKLTRLSELEKENLEKISDLNDEELGKAAVLNRAHLMRLVKLDAASLKAELRALRVIKIKRAEDLDERKIPEANLTQLREKFETAKEGFQNAKEKLMEARKELKKAIVKKIKVASPDADISADIEVEVAQGTS